MKKCPLIDRECIRNGCLCFDGFSRCVHFGIQVEEPPVMTAPPDLESIIRESTGKSGDKSR